MYEYLKTNLRFECWIWRENQLVVFVTSKYCTHSLAGISAVPHQISGIIFMILEVFKDFTFYSQIFKQKI